MKKIIMVLLLLLMLEAVYSADVHGRVYDFSLTRLTNIIIEINTQPVQRQISIDGSYSFNVPPGSYTITAKTRQNDVIVSEPITVASEGSYTLDLITFVDISEEEELLNETELGIEDTELLEGKSYALIIAIIITLTLIITGFVYFRFKKKKQVAQKKEPKSEEEENSLPAKILEIIKKQDGRITQKDLRKQLPYSEAKISLVVTELEAKGKIQKIKKGRANVIILK